MKATSVPIKMALAGLVPLVSGMMASCTNNASTEKDNRSQFEDGLFAWHDLMRLNPTTSGDRDETWDPIRNLHYDEVSIHNNKQDNKQWQ